MRPRRLPNRIARGSEKHSSAATPAYLEKIAAAFALGIIREGSVCAVEVFHDDDCAHWSGGPCDCEAEVEIRPLDDEGGAE